MRNNKEVIKEIQKIRDEYTEKFFSNYKQASEKDDRLDAMYQLGQARGVLIMAMEIMEVLYEKLD